jgi:hypothetical protein
MDYEMGYAHAVVKHPNLGNALLNNLPLRAMIEIDQDGFELVVDNYGDIIYACGLSAISVCPEYTAELILLDKGFTFVSSFRACQL